MYIYNNIVGAALFPPQLLGKTHTHKMTATSISLACATTLPIGTPTAGAAAAVAIASVLDYAVEYATESVELANKYT